MEAQTPDAYLAEKVDSMVTIFLDGIDPEDNVLPPEAMSALGDEFDEVDVSLREAVFRAFLNKLGDYGYGGYLQIFKGDA